jgi:hypothetical protein
MSGKIRCRDRNRGRQCGWQPGSVRLATLATPLNGRTSGVKFKARFFALGQQFRQCVEEPAELGCDLEVQRGGGGLDALQGRGWGEAVLGAAGQEGVDEIVVAGVTGGGDTVSWSWPIVPRASTLKTATFSPPTSTGNGQLDPACLIHASAQLLRHGGLFWPFSDLHLVWRLLLPFSTHPRPSWAQGHQVAFLPVGPEIVAYGRPLRSRLLEVFQLKRRHRRGVGSDVSLERRWICLD